MYGRFFVVVLSLFLLLFSTFFRNVLSHGRARAAQAAAEPMCPDTYLPIMGNSGASHLMAEIPSYCRHHRAK